MVPGAAKADIWRLAVIWRYGGVYVDSDVVALRPFREVLDNSRPDFSKMFDASGCKVNNVACTVGTTLTYRGLQPRGPGAASGRGHIGHRSHAKLRRRRAGAVRDAGAVAERVRGVRHGPRGRLPPMAAGVCATAPHHRCALAWHPTLVQYGRVPFACCAHEGTAATHLARCTSGVTGWRNKFCTMCLRNCALARRYFQSYPGPEPCAHSVAISTAALTYCSSATPGTSHRPCTLPDGACV